MESRITGGKMKQALIEFNVFRDGTFTLIGECCGKEMTIRERNLSLNRDRTYLKCAKCGKVIHADTSDFYSERPSYLSCRIQAS